MIATWDALEKVVTARGLNPRVIPALADAAVNVPVTNSSYRKAAGISTQVAKLDLKNLVVAGFLEPKGEARGRFYVAAPTVRAIREENRRPDIVGDPYADQAPAQPMAPVQPSLFGDTAA